MAKIGGVFPDKRKDAATGKVRQVGWRCVWYDFTGRRRERRCPGLSKDQARELWRQLSAEGQLEAAGARVPADRVTLAQYAAEFFARRPDEVDPATLRGELATWQNHIAPALGDVPLSQLTPDRVRAAMAGLRHREHTGRPGRPRERKASPQLARKFKVILTRIVRRAAASGLFGSRAMFEGERWCTPFSSVKPPKAPKVTRARLEPREFEALLRAAFVVGGARALMVVALAALAGFRRGEVPALEWERDFRWLDADGARMPAGAELTRDPAALLVTVQAEHAKDREERTLALRHPEVVAVFLGERRRSIGQRFVFRHERRLMRRGVVVREAGDALAEVMTSEQWTEIRRVADVSAALRFHDLRGSFAVALLAGGVAESAVQELLGHASVATTRRHYTEVRTRTRIHDAGAAFEGLQLGLGLGLDADDTPALPAVAKADHRVGRTSAAGLARDARGRGLAAASTGDTYGDALREARVSRGVSQMALAELLAAALGGTARTWQQRVSGLERGAWRVPTADRATVGAVLAEALDAPALRFAPTRQAAGGAA